MLGSAPSAGATGSGSLRDKTLKMTNKMRLRWHAQDSEFSGPENNQLGLQAARRGGHSVDGPGAQ